MTAQMWTARAAGEPFSARIRRRRELWWGANEPTAGWRRYPAAAHRLRRRHTFVRRDAPPDAWRCCEYWQHTLINKWNSREFVARLGCRLPALYWVGQLPSVRRLRSLRHFVVRPVWGAVRRGVYVIADGRDLLRHAPAPAARLHRSLLRSLPRRWPAPLMLEEFVRTAAGEYALPTEYKLHTFGDRVAAVQIFHRTSIYDGGVTQRMYTPDWQPFTDPMDVAVPRAPVVEAPACLDEMLECASRLGRELGTYMRVDFFATDRGCVFNEFSSTPRRGQYVTPFCDALFAALWDEHCPGTT